MGLWMTKDFQQLLLLDGDDAAYHNPFVLVEADQRKTKTVFYRIDIPLAAWLLHRWRKFKAALAAGKLVAKDAKDTSEQFDSVFDWVKKNLDTEAVKKFKVEDFEWPVLPMLPETMD